MPDGRPIPWGRYLSCANTIKTGGVMSQDDTYLNAKKVVQARRGLYAHAVVYVIVNAVLLDR